MKLILGDSLEKLKDLPTSTIDAVVTDPPYGLKFMNKHWDCEVPSEELWREVYRVLKPGAHVLSFFGTRTYHAGVTRIEAAGFEVRDMLSWLYGSGFPKSLDVSKAIDKAAGAEREVIGYEASRARPNKKGFAKITSAIETAGNAGVKDNGATITAPATDDAKRWQGWGTALKPANEPIVLARKPLEKGLTVAENLLKWGTGALAIDACRIEAADQAVLDAAVKRMTGNAANAGAFQSSAQIKPNSAQGRWPANVLFDEEAATALDAQSGTLKNGGQNTSSPDSEGALFGNRKSGNTKFAGDSGGASRFFYVAKASKRERNAGLEGMQERESSKVGQTVWTNECQACGKSRPQTEKQCGSCGGELAKVDREKPASANHHPTVKPIKLMEYLCTLITPTGGIILDPFMGSGTTGCAAVKLGFEFFGIEREAEYIAIAHKRIEHWRSQKPDCEEGGDPDQLSFPEVPA